MNNTNSCPSSKQTQNTISSYNLREIKHTRMMFAMTLRGSGGRTLSRSSLAGWANRTRDTKLVRLALPSPTHSLPPLPSPPLRASITPLQPLMQPVAGRGNKPALVTAVTAGVILMVVWAIDCFSTRSGEHLQGGRSHLVTLLHCPPLFFKTP